MGPSAVPSNTLLSETVKEVESVLIKYAADANLRDTANILETGLFKITFINQESPKSNI